MTAQKNIVPFSRGKTNEIVALTASIFEQLDGIHQFAMDQWFRFQDDGGVTVRRDEMLERLGEAEEAAGLYGTCWLG